MLETSDGESLEKNQKTDKEEEEEAEEKKKKKQKKTNKSAPTLDTVRVAPSALQLWVLQRARFPMYKMNLVATFSCSKILFALQLFILSC